MILHLKNSIDVNKAKTKLNRYIEQGRTIELTAKKITRTTRQNSALHKFFEIISYQLNELGMEFNYSGISGKELSLMYTPELVKEFIWRPIQLALFDINSTSKIDTDQMNKIIDVITKFFAERGVEIYFPSIETLLNEEA